MSDILIVGSAGFTGANIANYMVQFSKYSVSSIDNLKEQNLHSLAPAMAARNRHQFYLMDLNDFEMIDKVLDIERPKYIIYNALQDGKIDTTLLFNLLKKTLDKSNNYVEKVVVLSKDMYDYSNQNNYIENSIANDLDVMRQLPDGKEFYYVKMCELIGQRQLPGSFIPDTILASLSGKSIESEDDLKREWIYIKDLFAGVLTLIESDLETGTYRVCSGLQASRKDISSYLSNVICGSEKSYTFESVMPDQSFPNDKSYLPVKNMKFATSDNTLEGILEHVACWYRDNRKAWGM